MDSSHEFYMREVIALAKKNASSLGGGPFGAMIVKDGEMLASATNTVTVDNDPTAHAEVNVIRSACKKLGSFDLSGAILYSSCEPCPMCLSASYWAHIDSIYFAADRYDAAKAGFDDDFIYKELKLSFEERSIRTIRLMPTEGLTPFELWMDNDKRINY